MVKKGGNNGGRERGPGRAERQGARPGSGLTVRAAAGPRLLAWLHYDSAGLLSLPLSPTPGGVENCSTWGVGSGDRRLR